MDQFVTTYRKDFLWPYVKTIGIRPSPEQLYQPRLRDEQGLCACHCIDKPRPTSEQNKVFGPSALQQESWSRLGPMGPLLDPKMYPAKVGTSPESLVSRYDQPNVFLQKLQEKYPFIYECLRTSPPDDLISRINRDRLRTTYQVDFCKMMEYPSAPYDELLRAAGLSGIPPCPEPIRLPGDPYRPRQRAVISGGGGGRARDISSKSGGGGSKSDETKHCVGTCKGPVASMTAGATEYQDVISRLGTMIIRDCIHCPPNTKQERHIL